MTPRTKLDILVELTDLERHCRSHANRLYEQDADDEARPWRQCAQFLQSAIRKLEVTLEDRTNVNTRRIAGHQRGR
jgi:hypothetical protein